VYEELRWYGILMQRFWREGFDDVDKSIRDEDRSSPRRHCPQKATEAVAATVASRGSLRLRPLIRDDSMMVLIGGRGGRREERGVRFLTPLRIKFSRGPPFHSTL
jgi:hypothetical protein